MSTNLAVKVLTRTYWLIAFATLAAAASLIAKFDWRWASSMALVTVLTIIASRFEAVKLTQDRLVRTGLIAFLERWFSQKNNSLPLDRVEMITTEAIRVRRSLKRIKYFYKVVVSGHNTSITVMLLGNREDEGYQLIKAIFNILDDSKLDPRSSELKQYLNDLSPEGELTHLARRVEIDKLSSDSYQNLSTTILRKIANNLKLEGDMQPALRCFSLAYQKEPRNAHLLYEMARFFRSLALIDNPRLLTRSKACLRLAAFLAKDQPKLLERIGETYFERLDYKMAARCFSKALGIEPGLYRANVGLAEIALRSGKLAQVAHFYSVAASVSNDDAQRELAVREANYYGRLCSDEDYFEAEIDRMSKFSNFLWARNLAALVLVICWLTAVLIGRFYPDWLSLAWSMVLSTTVVWCFSTLLSFYYGQRQA